MRIREQGRSSVASGPPNDVEGTIMLVNSVGLVDIRLEVESSSSLFGYANSGDTLTFFHLQMVIIITSTPECC